jgi:hypothetical protein
MNIGALFKIKAGVEGLEQVQRLRQETALVSSAGEGMGRVFAGVKGQIAAAFSVGAVIAFMKTTVTAAMEADQAQARLHATIRAAGITAREIDALAEAMQRGTGFDDESIRNASAQFLKFGNIHKGVFEQGIGLSADLAFVMGTDVVNAAHLVGKALSNPADGMGQLERSVGKFTAAQREAIKQMADAGNVAGAQAEILKLLQGRIGGAAGGGHSGLTKDVKDLANAFGDLAEAIGKSRPVAGAGGGFLGYLKDELTTIKDLIESGTWFDQLYYWSGAMGLENLGRGMVGIGQRRAPDRTPPVYEDQNMRAGRVGGLVPAPTQEAMATMSEAERKQYIAGWVAYIEALESEWEDGLRGQAAATEKHYEKLKARLEERKKDAAALAQVFGQIAQEQVDADEELIYTWDKLGNRVAVTRQEYEALLQSDKDAVASMLETADLLQEHADGVVYTWDEAGNRIEVAREQWDSMAKDSKKDMESLRDMIEGWGKEASRTFVDWASGAKVSIRDVVSTMLKEFATMMMYRNVFGPIFSSISGAIAGGTTSASVSHDGRTPGQGGRSRAVPAGVFAGAPRLHSGLAADEFPAILQRGERVIPRGGSAGVSVSVMVNMQTGEVETAGNEDDARQLGNLIGVTVRQVLIDEQRPGGLLYQQG